MLASAASPETRPKLEALLAIPDGGHQSLFDHFDLLENETDPGVRAVLGHWLFVYTHPYPDGNGRVARF